MSDVYNEAYFTNFGHENNDYKNNWPIIRTLEGLSKFLCENLEFETHLDIGCAMGYLVRSMHNRSKQTRGFDISEYAIDNADENIKPFLTVHDIFRPFGLTYDLVTCVEVVEHIEPNRTERVIQNICNATKKYVYFSSAYDKSEPTHVNVRTIGQWVGLFEQRGLTYMPLKYDNIPWGFIMERK